MYIQYPQPQLKRLPWPVKHLGSHPGPAGETFGKFLSLVLRFVALFSIDLAPAYRHNRVAGIFQFFSSGAVSNLSQSVKSLRVFGSVLGHSRNHDIRLP